MKQGWVVKKLGEVCTVIAGQSPEGKYYNSEKNGLPFYQGKKEFTGKYLGQPTTWTTKITKEAEKNDILMSVRAPVGPINFSTQKICIGRGLAAIRAQKLIDKEFLFNFLLKHENEIVGNTGAVFNSINKAQIEAIEIPLPSLSEQQRIVAILDEVFDAIAKAKVNAEQNLKNAKELFESYLQSVFETKGEGWEEKRLDEVVILIDSLHRTPSYQSDGYSMVRVTDIKTGFLSLHKTKKVDKKTFDEFSKKHIPNIGDIVFARVGSYGVSSFVNSNELFCLGQNTVFILPKINSSYVYLFLNSPYAKKQLDKMVAGTTQPTISLKSIKEIRIPLPTLIIQQTIVTKLDALSEQTKKLEAIYHQKLADLEELKKSILHKAFNGEL